MADVTGRTQRAGRFATGEKDVEPQNPDAGRKYFLKLAGDNVFAVLAADRKDVRDFRARKGSLFGFFVEGTELVCRACRFRYAVEDEVWDYIGACAPISMHSTLDGDDLIIDRQRLERAAHYF